MDVSCMIGISKGDFSSSPPYKNVPGSASPARSKFNPPNSTTYTIRAFRPTAIFILQSCWTIPGIIV